MGMKTTMKAAGAVVLLGLLAACGDGGTETTGRAAPSTVPVADVEVGIEAAVDWASRTVEVEGLDGYGIEFCEGDAPLLCVERGGEWIGVIELASFPDEEALDEGIEAWADDFVTTMAEDRRVGCDPAFEVVGDEPTPAPFAGEDGHRYGFTGRIDGRVVERVVVHVAAVDGTLHLLTVNGLADDGCLSRESELPVDAVDDLTPVLAALAHGSTNLPAVPDAPPAGEDEAPAGSGDRSGWLRGRNAEGFVDVDAAVMLSGDEAVAAAREDGQLPPEGMLPNDFYIDDDEASITTLPVSDRLTVELYDCTAGCELRTVDAQAFLRHEVQPFGGEHAFVSLEVRDGVVVALREIYVP